MLSVCLRLIPARFRFLTLFSLDRGPIIAHTSNMDVATQSIPGNEPAADLVNTEAVARHFGVTRDTVSRWVRDNLIPYFRPSRNIVRFRLHDVEAALTRGGDNGKRQDLIPEPVGGETTAGPG